MSSKKNYGKPAVDVIEFEDKILVLLPLAGVCVKDVSVSLDDDVLFISGIRNFPFKLPKVTRDVIFLNSECYWGKFSRSIILPHILDKNKMNAEIKNGILYVSIIKKTKQRKKYLKIVEKKI